MLKITHKISIGKLNGLIYKIKSFSSISINEDSSMLTSYAQIEIPINLIKSKEVYTIENNKLIIRNLNSAPMTIEVGDTVSIELGYHKKKLNDKKQFVGYVVNYEITKERNLIIYCENIMWLFKQVKINATWGQKEKVGIDRIIHDMIGYTRHELRKKYDTSLIAGIPNADDTESGYLLQTEGDITDAIEFTTAGYKTVAEVFQYIQETYKIYVYARNYYYSTNNINIFETKNLMYAGLRFPTSLKNYYRTVKVCSSGNIDAASGYNINIDSFIKNSSFNKDVELIVIINAKIDKDQTLIYATIDGKTIIKGKEAVKKALGGRNYKVEYKIPYINSINMESTVLDKWINFEDNNFSGEVIILGLPITRQGDQVEFSDGNKYIVKAVNTLCNSGEGFIQRLQLYGKIN